ncbi:MAG: amino-acid N-acetyltransferase [Luminiphilus sp.]|nr:amino-acid N-acetyltransferase [Luminiphilus sp.]
MSRTDSHIDWFRHTGPYIKAHRGRTFVVYLGNGALESAGLLTLVHDLALLHSLGVRLVLVHATRSAIDGALAGEQVGEFHQGIRVTDDATLAIARDTAAQQRVQLEQLLSMGLPNTPLRGARLRVLGGNVVAARPLGILGGVDYCHSGTVRRIDAGAIRGILDHDAIALLSPLGYSPAGELFSVSAAELAETVAVAVGADKLIFLDRHSGLEAADGTLIRQCTVAVAQQLQIADGEQQRLRDAACRACCNGVTRSHLISYEREGALLEELFTHDGSGTLIAQDPYEQARPAEIDDIASIVELIRPLEDSGALVKRSRERLEEEIGHFSILERDGRVVACAALYPYCDEQVGEIACVATHPDYRGAGRAEQLLQELITTAKNLSLTRVFALTTQSTHWFLEQEFTVASPDSLPIEKQRFYNWQRNATVLSRPV